MATISEHSRSKSAWPLNSIAQAINQTAYTTSDAEAFRQQELLFAVLNQLLIGALLILQVVSLVVRGRPEALVIAVLVLGFAVQAARIGWLYYRKMGPVSAHSRSVFTCWSIGLNSLLALVLTSLTIRGDTAYYALMLLPIIEAAFRLSLGATIAIALLADFISFLGAYGLKFGEYIEAGAMSVIFTVMGVLVWLLVNNLRQREAQLAHNLRDLESARHQLLSEEKLAAIGRLSRALAHEIRNPVAMISSSLATAMRANQNETERSEMFGIAAKEAARLERLTTDFLLYARPRPAQIGHANVADTLNYVAAVARAHASNGGVAIQVTVDNDLGAEFDAAQIQQALLNLLLNAIDACGRGDAVNLAAETNNNGTLRIDVFDPAGPIPEETVGRIFEPLFTTKQGGTGLGLAIARNIAHTHGGEIMLRINEPGRVCFSIEIPTHHPD